MALDDVTGAMTFRLTKPPVCEFAWWIDAPREQFYQRCAKERAEHMAGSQGEKWVSGASVNVLFDVNRKR